MKNIWASIYNFIQTSKHKLWVLWYTVVVCCKLLNRGVKHDFSKYGKKESSGYASVIFNLKNLAYGSDEYKTALEEIKPSTVLHYSQNRHHPEFHPNGVGDMSMLDLTEMMIDWRAATRRHKNGDIFKSIEINQDRFKYNETIKRLMLSLAKELK